MTSMEQLYRKQLREAFTAGAKWANERTRLNVFNDGGEVHMRKPQDWEADLEANSRYPSPIDPP